MDTSYSDEKLGDTKVDNAESILDDVGDVYEDPRQIDLDENGKERPIGESYLLSSHPLRSLRSLLLPRNGHRRCYSPDIIGG